MRAEEIEMLIHSLTPAELEALRDDPSELVREVAGKALQALGRNSTSVEHQD